MAMAQRQADAMARANTLSHDAAGSFASRVHAAGLDAARAAENLGGGYYSTAEAFAGWRASSGHDANLRMKEATRFGIALAKDPQTRYRAWWALVVAGEPEKRVEISAGPSAGSARTGRRADTDVAAGKDFPYSSHPTWLCRVAGMILSKLTSKAQTTVPQPVRKACACGRGMKSPMRSNRIASS